MQAFRHGLERSNAFTKIGASSDWIASLVLDIWSVIMNKNTANLALLCSSITVTGSLFTGNAGAQEPEPMQ